jgi:hypothetical protein
MKQGFWFGAARCGLPVGLSLCSLAMVPASPVSARAEVSSLAGGMLQEFVPVTNRAGDYAVTLRVPKEGVYAGESIDIEFRVEDMSKVDPVLGALGVPKVVSSAVVTMPEMEGMPEQRPKIHAEGVPGDYGIECFFPHGGGYRIALTLRVPGVAEPLRTAFSIEVGDAEARKGRKPPVVPYTAQVIAKPEAGKPSEMKFRIVSTKGKDLVKDFDVAHTKIFHLLMASEDLSWFAHEHPEQLPDGTFKHTQVFPHGGVFRIYSDVAPRGAGSQILVSRVEVSGSAPAKVKLTPTPLVNEADGIRANLQGVADLPVGKSVPVTFVLTDAATGAAVRDLEQYLGAYGHLMIIHEDGRTVVHSHPAEDEAGLAKSRSGTVVFSARFPKPGLYKAWGQFQRGGRVATIPFVFRVGGGK